MWILHAASQVKMHSQSPLVIRDTSVDVGGHTSPCPIPPPPPPYHWENIWMLGVPVRLICNTSGARCKLTDDDHHCVAHVHISLHCKTKKKQGAGRKGEINAK